MLESQFGKRSDIARVTTIMVTGLSAVTPVQDVSRLGAEVIPYAWQATVFTARSFDLEGRSGAAPLETVRMHIGGKCEHGEIPIMG